MVEHCAIVAPRPTQQRASKPLSWPRLVVSTINTFRRGHSTELIDITPLVITIYSGNLNIHQK